MLQKGGATVRDFPIFDTPYGVVSLTMKEIPYRACAYIRILSVFDGNVEALLRECVDFCTACGAERIYATGDRYLEDYPIHTAVLEMRGEARCDAEHIANIFPVTQETVAHWRAIYNERMRNTDNASTLEARDEGEIIASGGAYFVHERGELIGIGWLGDGELRCIASCVRGGGMRVMHTLLSVAEGAELRLEVASTNARAISLYEKCGFLPVKELATWYRVRG